jgi:uncharacterized membrane protein YdjX (TVP38/TMEM64 family)
MTRCQAAEQQQHDKIDKDCQKYYHRGAKVMFFLRIIPVIPDNSVFLQYETSSVDLDFGMTIYFLVFGAGITDG